MASFTGPRFGKASRLRSADPDMFLALSWLGDEEGNRGDSELAPVAPPIEALIATPGRPLEDRWVSEYAASCQRAEAAASAAATPRAQRADAAEPHVRASAEALFDRVVRPAAWDRTTSDRPATSDGAATSDPATSTGRPASAAAPAKQKLVDAVRALGPRHWLAEGGYDAAKNVWRNDGFHAKDVECVVRAGTARVTRHCGHGASGALTAVCGGPDVELDFGNLFSGNSETFTVASLTRYAGAHMGRVLQGTQDWYHGHWGNPGRSEALVGHCKYGSVVKTDLSSKRTANIADWLAMTATNGADATAFANGERCCVRAGGRDAGSLGINRGAFGFERSDFAVAEVLVFDYALTEGQCRLVDSYLRSKLRRAAPAGRAPLKAVLSKRDRLDVQRAASAQRRAAGPPQPATRHLADSKFERVFHTYGHANTAPISGGVGYGNSLYTHNAKAHDPRHQKSLQVFPTALRRAKDKFNLQPNDEFNTQKEYDAAAATRKRATAKGHRDRLRAKRAVKAAPPPPPPQEAPEVAVGHALSLEITTAGAGIKAAGRTLKSSCSVRELLSVYE